VVERSSNERTNGIAVRRIGAEFLSVSPNGERREVEVSVFILGIGIAIGMIAGFALGVWFAAEIERDGRSW